MFKRLTILTSVIALAAALSGCADSKVIEGKKYAPYGIFNSNTADPKIEYRLVLGNIFWDIILFETVLFPIVSIGFFAMEPVGKAAVE